MNNSRGRGWNGKRGAYGKGGNGNTGPGQKRFRGDEENEDADDFNTQTAMMDDEDFHNIAHDVAMMEEPEEIVEDIEISRRKKWQRPDPPQIDPSNEKFIFQQIDIDSYIGKPLVGMPGASSGPVPVMRMFGVTEKVEFD